MPNLFFISDTHFGHANFLKFTDDQGKKIREFDTIHEMNEKMIENWNSVVRDQDKVYHLGDVTFRYGSEFTELMFRLKGHKRLVVGNHDDLKEPSLLYCFEKVSLWRIFKEHNIICTHVPTHPEYFRYADFNVHGHLHQNTVMDDKGNPDPRYFSVCVEKTNYFPLNIEDIKVQLGKRVVPLTSRKKSMKP